jgi:phosphoesterase RecJ-like protein
VTMIDWSGFVELVRSHQRFVVTCHVRPDGDALGSELALAAVLEQLGKDVLVANAFAVPPHYRFLAPPGRFRQLGIEVTAAEIERREVLIVVDTMAWGQLGAMADVLRTTRLKKVAIDHHVSGDDLGGLAFQDAQAEATGRLVIEAADALGVRLTPEIAVPAFVALTTDTGWFRFSSTRPETFALAARLTAAGAKPDAVFQALYENNRLARLHLQGVALSRSQTELDGRLIVSWLTQADFVACQALASESEDLINATLSVGSTQAAVFLVEQPDGRVKASFRSRCDVDCARVAEQFGGGGHRKAAGAMLPGPMREALARALDAMRAAMS